MAEAATATSDLVRCARHVRSDGPSGQPGADAAATGDVTSADWCREQDFPLMAIVTCPGDPDDRLVLDNGIPWPDEPFLDPSRHAGRQAEHLFLVGATLARVLVALVRDAVSQPYPLRAVRVWPALGVWRPRRVLWYLRALGLRGPACNRCAGRRLTAY